jgi:hypothetical protein
MAVALADAAILIVDAQLRSLASANLPAMVDGVPFCVKMPG